MAGKNTAVFGIYPTHPAVDAMLMLVRENDLTPSMVTRIESQTHPRRFAHTNRPDPRGALDAKFMIQSPVPSRPALRPLLLMQQDQRRYTLHTSAI